MNEAPEIASVLEVLGARRDDLRISQELIEVLPVPVFFKGRDGRYLGVNRAWEEFFGVARRDIIGGKGVDPYPHSPSGAEDHAAVGEELLEHAGGDSPRARAGVGEGRRGAT